MQCLYDEQGYEIKLELSETYNPQQAGESNDARDLGVLVSYIGAVEPEHDPVVWDNDMYVLSRLEFPYTGEWNYHALREFWGAEENGTWTSPCSIAYLKDPGIFKSGLKLVYYVPQFLVGLHSTMRISVNGEIVKEIALDSEGIYTEIMDLAHIGADDQQYLKDAHRILKILLQEFDSVCKKYDLRYYLICGSLLGAVRHKDLIPWDDDVDVAMPRKDFDILLKHAKEEWGEDKDIMFLNYNQMGNHAFLDYMTRIVYMKEEIPVNIFRKIKGKGRSDVDNHLPMDIYVLDNASNNEVFHNIQTQLIRGLYGLAMGHRAYVDPNDYTNRDEKTQRIVKTSSSIGRHIPLSWILGCYEWVRKWNRNKSCEDYFESNGFIYCIPWRFKQEWFGEGVRLPLGDIMVNAPQDYEAFLAMHYEDYRQYPPMHLRRPTHSVEASGIF